MYMYDEDVNKYKEYVGLPTVYASLTSTEGEHDKLPINAHDFIQEGVKGS